MRRQLRRRLAPLQLRSVAVAGMTRLSSPLDIEWILDPPSGLPYQHCTPIEVVAMSRTGVAVGYDLLRWGERASSGGADTMAYVAIANRYGVQFLIESTLETLFIFSHKPRDGAPHVRYSSAAPRAYIAAKNFLPWKDLSRSNADFCSALLWLPEAPMGALEALATALE